MENTLELEQTSIIQQDVSTYEMGSEVFAD
jgi:hypothetical protein